jgi:hypothetical protein
VDQQGLITFCNPATLQVLDETEEELIGKNLFNEFELVSGDKLDMSDFLYMTSQGSIRENLQTIVRTKNRRILSIRLVSIIFHDRSNRLGGITILAEDIGEQKKNRRVQELQNSILRHSLQSKDMPSFFTNVHKELKKLLRVENFFVVLRSEGSPPVFPYVLDKHRKGANQKNDLQVIRELVEHVLDRKETVHLSREDLLDLADSGDIPAFAELPLLWVGIPLRSKKKILGLIVLEHFGRRQSESLPGAELLDFISGQVALTVERMLNEELLSEQSSRMQAIFESSTHVVWSVNRDMKLTSFNQNFAELMSEHYGVAPALGKVYGHEGSTTEAAYLGEWRQKYEKGFRGLPADYEVRFYSGREDERWYRIFINPIYREDGSIREVAGIAHNISKRKKSEKALYESEAKFRNIFESFQDIYFRCRVDGTITMVSPSVKELAGYETYEVLGNDIKNYYLYGKRTKNLIRQLVNEQGVRNFDATLIKSDGKLLKCICNVRLITNYPGQPREIEGVARDVTQLKQANEDLKHAKDIAEKSLKVKDAFLANMSHEIRTPMNGIISMIDLLSETRMDEEQADYVNTIKKSSEILLNILNDILDLSKIEAGKMKLFPTAVSPRAALQKVHALFSQQAFQKNIQFEQQVDEAVPPYLKIDETRFLQVANNLTSNALKFTEEGGRVSISLKPEGEARQGAWGWRQRFRLSVKDTGIGISEEAQQRLFQNFSQVDSTASKKYKGTGLGLAISRRLSQLMKGEMGVTSSPGEGSTFWFTFLAEPLESGPEAEAVNVPHHEPEESLLALQPHVLLVDDNEVNRKVSGQILQKSHCQVSFAGSGPEAIEQVQSGHFDLVLMDIQMPGMDGIEATRRIRELDMPRVPPIVAMTAYSMRGDKERFLEAGMDDYVAKPIRPISLIRKVAEVLAPHSGSRTETAEKTSSQVIDFSILKELEKYGGSSLIEDTLNDFEQEGAELLKNCTESLKNKDYENILSKLHTLKGNAATLGIQQLADTARKIEARLKRGAYPSLPRDLDELGSTFSAFQQAHDRFLKSQSHE